MVEVAKALGSSFKLVTLAPRTVREMTQLPKETQKNWGHKQIKKYDQYASPRREIWRKLYLYPNDFRYLMVKRSGEFH